MSLCLGAQVCVAVAAVLVPITGPEQPHSSQEGTRGVNQSLHATKTARRPRLAPGCANSRPDISQSLRGIGIASAAFFTQSQRIPCGAMAMLGAASTAGSSKLPEAA